MDSLFLNVNKACLYNICLPCTCVYWKSCPDRSDRFRDVVFSPLSSAVDRLKGVSLLHPHFLGSCSNVVLSSPHFFGYNLLNEQNNFKINCESVRELNFICLRGIPFVYVAIAFALIIIRELKRAHFWDADGDRKWAIFTFNLPWHNHIHIAKYFSPLEISSIKIWVTIGS